MRGEELAMLPVMFRRRGGRSAGSWAVDAACCEEVHCARESDEAGEEERGAGFHGNSSASEDEAVIPALVGDSGGVSHDRGKITFQIRDESLKFQGLTNTNLVAAGKVIVIPSPTAYSSSPKLAR
jgi:hypothetical protein